MKLPRGLVLLFAGLGSIALSGCGITGETYARTAKLDASLVGANPRHSVVVATFRTTPGAATSKAIGAYNWGEFSDSDLATLRDSVALTLAHDSSIPAGDSEQVHLRILHFAQAFTNNGGAVLAIFDWCLLRRGRLLYQERFYAAHDTGDRFLNTETVGTVKSRVIQAAVARIAGTALAKANGLPLPPRPTSTFDDAASACATVRSELTASTPGALPALVQSTAAGGTASSTGLSSTPEIPPTDWATDLSLRPE
jgi:hypothetical protein